jgi:hypothetical protein
MYLEFGLLTFQEGVISFAVDYFAFGFDDFVKFC